MNAPEPSQTAAGLDRARVLLETARQLGSSLEPDAIFARLTASVCGAMRCDGIIVSSLDREHGVIRCSYAWVGGNVLDHTTLPPLEYRPDSAGMQTQVIRTRRPMLFSDVAERVRDPKGRFYEVEGSGSVRDLKDSEPPKSKSAIMVPLLLEGEVVGVVQVMADAEDVYVHDDLELLEGISLLLAVALENARLYERAREELEERRRAERDLRIIEEALRDADRRKDEFLATLGHELRNPLNPIKSAVELLRASKTSEADRRWSHDVIDRQVAHFTRLIDDLLDVGRITQGKLALRRDVVDLGAVLVEAVEAVQSLVDGAGQRLSWLRPDEPILLDADSVRLAQVFSNLLHNAAKYTSRGGRIDIDVVKGAGDVMVSVRDDGAGITRENLGQVFDLFYQGHRSVEHAHGGLGIGLTLAKRLIEMHGGSIEAFSDGPGRGSRFVVRLPRLATPPQADGAWQAPAGTAARAMRILVADDNRDSADSMALLLRMKGHEVEAAYDGESAYLRVEVFRPEVVLLDIGMPRLSGYEVAERLRQQPWGRDLVLIAATGWGQDEDRRRTTAAGFDVHLVKPVDYDMLMRALSTLSQRTVA